jgi:hypothetical protein
MIFHSSQQNNMSRRLFYPNEIDDELLRLRQDLCDIHELARRADNIYIQDRAEYTERRLRRTLDFLFTEKVRLKREYPYS